MGAPPSDSGGVQDRSQWSGPQSRIFGRPGCVGSSKVDNNIAILSNYWITLLIKGVKSKTKGVSKIVDCWGVVLDRTAKNQYRKFETNNPQKRNCATTVPISTFMCLYELFIYSHNRSAYSAAENMWTDPGNIKIAHRHMNVEIPRKGIHKWDFRCSACWLHLLSFWSCSYRVKIVIPLQYSIGELLGNFFLLLGTYTEQIFYNVHPLMVHQRVLPLTGDAAETKKNAKYKNLFLWIVFAHQIVCGWIGNEDRQGKNIKTIWCTFLFVKKKSPIQYLAETELTKKSTFKRQIKLNMAAVRDHYRHLWIVFSAFIRWLLSTYLPIHILQKKGQWESNINVLFRFMYFQKLSCSDLCTSRYETAWPRYFQTEL
jgi:hypothetical protein